MGYSADFLVDHAYRHVWCSPGQDRQHIAAPQRISPRNGVLSNMRYGLTQINMPTAGVFYHVFTIGDLPPALVGMRTIAGKWVSVKAHCNASSLLIDLYLNNGLHLPAHRAYFLYTQNGALILAIEHTPKIADLGVVQPFARWRSNSYFDNPASGITKDQGIEIDGITPTTENQFYLFQAKWREVKLRKGYAMAYVNGQRVKDLNLTTLSLGDSVEYVYDASVKEVIELPINALKSFDSRLDNKGKYLLPRPGLGVVIDYTDDIDLFVLKYTLAFKYTGVYYHQNQPDAVRMVTHRDYAVPSAYLQGVVQDQKGWIWNDDLRVEIVVRESGWHRPLMDEAHRIKELFKLPEPERIKAMLGQSSVPVWKAAELEASAYPALMQADQGSVTRGLVEQAYGYNALSRVIGDTPIKLPVVNQGWVDLPYGLRGLSTVYEYTAEGQMTGWFIHDNSVQYPLRHPQTRYIEAYAGRGGVGLSTVYDAMESTLITGVDYRFYVCDIANGVALNNWRDVTGDERFYVQAGNHVTWKIASTKYRTALRSSQDFLSYTVDLDYRDDLLAMSIDATEVRAGRVPATGQMDIPPGQLDIWMNGWGMVEGIDYYVTWPELCIVNKSRLVDGPVQSVTVRGRGFCKLDMSRERVADAGFVQHGALSHNATFNVRDDKVCVIEIGGALYTREEVGFSEDHRLITTTVPNGTPYQVKHPIVPMMGLTDTGTDPLRAAAAVTDRQVEDYLSAYLPEPVDTLPDALPAWYPVFSPFTTKLIFDMLNGLLPMNDFKDEYSLAYLKERLAGYDWILQYDPALKNVDTRYVVIHPHPESGVIALNIYQYRLLDRAIKVFLNDQVVLNRHLVIVEEGFEHDQRDHPHPHRTYDDVGA